MVRRLQEPASIATSSTFVTAVLSVASVPETTQRLVSASRNITSFASLDHETALALGSICTNESK